MPQGKQGARGRRLANSEEILMNHTWKEQITEAEASGYRWGLAHPHASAEDREQAALGCYPDFQEAVLAYAFAQAAAKAIATVQNLDTE